MRVSNIILTASAKKVDKLSKSDISDIDRQRFTVNI